MNQAPNHPVLNVDAGCSLSAFGRLMAGTHSPLGSLRAPLLFPHNPVRSHGTIFVAGSLQGPGPAEATARTRAHIRAPLVRDVATDLDFVTGAWLAKLVAVIGSGLNCTS